MNLTDAQRALLITSIGKLHDLTQRMEIYAVNQRLDDVDVVKARAAFTFLRNEADATLTFLQGISN